MIKDEEIVYDKQRVQMLELVVKNQESTMNRAGAKHITECFHEWKSKCDD